MTSPSTSRDPGAAVDAVLRSLGDELDGSVHLPGDADWDLVRQAWNLAADQQPCAVVFAETAEDVSAVVRLAAAHGFRVAPQGTGHGAACLRTGDDVILLRTSRMTGVTIDAEARTARVCAGAVWRDVTVPAAEHGLAALAGAADDVGVVGYTLGGGIGWLARRYGLTANSVLAVEVVTADGELRRVDADRHPELFWALRGGGGSFGIVTALEFRLYPVDRVYAGALFWPVERASDVLHAWWRWSAGVPDTVTSMGRLLAFPQLPEVPEPMRGRHFVLVEAALLGDVAAAEALLAPLRDLQPVMDTFEVVPAPALSTLNMDPEAPTPAIADHVVLRELSSDALDALLAVVGPDADAPLVSVEIRHLGGALARSDPEHGAVDVLGGAYLAFALGVPFSPDMVASIETGVRALPAAMRHWDAGVGYSNFADQPTSTGRLLGAGAADRLRRIRATWDPDQLFLANHPVAVDH